MSNLRPVLLSLGLAGCGGSAPPCAVDSAPSAGPVGAGNVVLIVLDDLGVDKVGAYRVHPEPAPTPRLDALAAQGVRFTSAYSEPACSPTRAALLTGRRPFRTGIGSNVEPDGEHPGLPLGETTLPEALRRAGPYTSMAVGKWHLSRMDASALEAPLRHGFDRFDGILGNPEMSLEPGGDRDYFHWERVVDGQRSWSDQYLVTAQADAALEALETLPEPFFLYLGFSGIHGPAHLPPTELWAGSGADPSTLPGVADAMIAALDHELGRVLDAIGDDTTVIVVGDNGTDPDFRRAPSDPHPKGTVYPSMTHVPLIVSGPGIAPAIRPDLVHVVDLFPTVLELAGVDPEGELDGLSLVPALEGEDLDRACVVVEHFWPNGDRENDLAMSILDAGWALVEDQDLAGDALYLREPGSPVLGPDRSPPTGPDERESLARLRRWLRQDQRARRDGG